jgi:hypothetical protein
MFPGLTGGVGCERRAAPQPRPSGRGRAYDGSRSGRRSQKRLDLAPAVTMDWRSSGITTSVVGALKRGLNPRASELGLYVCGGRGRHSRNTPVELGAIADRRSLDGDELVRISRLTARIDNNCIADGFQIYLHSFIVAANSRTLHHQWRSRERTPLRAARARMEGRLSTSIAINSFFQFRSVAGGAAGRNGLAFSGPAATGSEYCTKAPASYENPTGPGASSPYVRPLASFFPRADPRDFHHRG